MSDPSRSRPRRAPATALVHPRIARGRRGAAPSLERSSTFRLDAGASEALATRTGHDASDTYGRFGTATTREAADMIAELEGAEAGVLFASGMAAIDAVFTALVPAGGALAVSADVYGGTEDLCERDLPERGVSVRRFDASDPGTLGALVRDGFTPDVVFCESISNPRLNAAALTGLAEITRARGSRLVVDATFVAGLAQRPLDRGADLVVHSATKFLNGHSDVIAGAACGPAPLVRRLFETMTRRGSNVDPAAAWLLARGLKTLPVRFARQCRSAATLADRLAAHAGVGRVLYPGRADHPTHAIAARELEAGLGGGVLAFELGDGREAHAAERFVSALNLCAHAVSLGGVETLVTIPRRSSHVGRSPAFWDERGIRAALVRVAVGLEDVDDLWDDLSAALDASARVVADGV